MAAFRTLAIGTGLTIALLSADLAAASTDNSRPGAHASRGVVVTRSAGTFDWLTRRSKARVYAVSARVPRQIGSGSWICSPAGFGRGSRCYAN